MINEQKDNQIENLDELIKESKQLEKLSLENNEIKTSLEIDEKFTSFKKDLNFRYNFIDNPIYKDILDNELFSNKEIRMDEKGKYTFVRYYNLDFEWNL